MAEPTISHAPPRQPRKRRRPAVVCSECRRRKIACDRKSPCGQCALHNVECVYVTGSVAPAYGRPVRAQPPPGDESSVGGAGGRAPAPSPLDEQDPPATVEPHVMSAMGERSSRFGGRLAKTRLFGRSHWMNNMDEFKVMHSLTHLVHFVPGSVIYKSMRTCKRIARVIKAEDQRRIADVDDQPTWFTPPPRPIADRLVDLYLNAFEGHFRILHMPTFRREYEAYMDRTASGSTDAPIKHEPKSRCTRGHKSAVPAHDTFTIKLILVLALGSCFYDNADDPAAAAALQYDLRIAATRAVTQRPSNMMDVAFCAPLDKHRLNLDTLQIYCLVTVARQTSALDVGDDLTWFTTGGLLHTAFGMGLNRDPSHFKSLSFAQAEMRRRLWATILELAVQSSLDQGMPPLVSSDDYDCAPPTNLDDEDFDADDADDGDADDERPDPLSPFAERKNRMNVHPQGRPDSEYTHSTMQRLLCRSLPVRLKITKAINGLGPGLTYERALALSTELLEACRYTAQMLRAAPLNSQTVLSGAPEQEQERAGFAKLQIAFYEILTRRFHHSLHSPFARKAAHNVQFYFSRRARLDSVLRILSFFRADNGVPDVHAPLPLVLVRPSVVDDPCRRLWLIGRGLLKCTMVDVKATAMIELIHQLQEDHFVPGSDLTLSQRELYETVRTIVALSQARVESGETNVKGILFFRGGLAQVEALMTGRPVRQTIVEAAGVAAATAIRSLRAVAARRGIALPDDIDVDVDDAAPESSSNLNDNCNAILQPSTEALQTKEMPAALVPGPSAFDSSTDTPSVSFAAHPIPLGLPTGHGFGGLMAGPSTPSQVLGMDDGGSLLGDSSNPDSGVQMSSVGSRAAPDAAAWTDEWMMDAQDLDLCLDNWFFPYNDRINNS